MTSAATSAPARTVGDVAELVRSKNAGPFWQTLDVFCDSDDAYRELADESLLTPDRIAALYRVDASAVRIFRLPDLRVIKISFPRPVSSGSANDRDVHAGQQHVPLLLMPVA
ncbi:DUF4387 domain-containing protein [Desertimonas flava]|jgi:hypothetical protein|uniref:DUF4387 domain-containing protein n=1 Tax=Desertimonas flava TaxID=2064846 RepID=UPI000E343820|nr:DUF4387 domain-containing protein [Desertimonas flava]